jgi:hypothetical protein
MRRLTNLQDHVRSAVVDVEVGEAITVREASARGQWDVICAPEGMTSGS